MPIVFVHGVNNRMGPGYRAGVSVTKTYLKTYLAGAEINGKTFGADTSDPEFPYWGGHAATFAWGMASLPRGDMQSLGAAADPEFRAYLASVSDGVPGKVASEPLMSVAKTDFTRAVEMIGSLSLEQAPDNLVDDVASFVVASQAYAAENKNPTWLDTLTTDDQLLGTLSQVITQQGGVQAQGLGDVINAVKMAAVKLKHAAIGLAGTAVDKAGDFASSKLLSWTREPLNANLGRFFGDIFYYFNGRGDKNNPGPIPQAVLDGYNKAIANAPDDEPLVIVCHSLGGVISYDLISHFRPDLEVDLFVTVGSQVAHFEEMKLYKVSDKSIKAPDKAPRPPNIAHWINVYDPVDVFAYAAENVFDGVDFDGSYDTGTYVIKSHVEYFRQRRLYERLRERIDELT